MVTIRQVSAVTPVGVSAMQTAMCARTCAFQPRTVPFRDKRGQEIGICLVGGLGAELFGYERMVALGAAALEEIAAALGEEAVPMVVALPSAGRADDDERFTTGFPFELAMRAGFLLDKRRVAVVRTDRAGVGHAIVTARDWLERGSPRVVVGGVDSYFHPAVLAALDADYRLGAMGAEDGFVPAEAASFFVLEKVGDGPRITRVAVGHDPSGEREPAPDAPPDIARTMTGLLQEIAEQVGLARWVLNDDNGETHRERWWSLASARETVEIEADIHRIPDAMGDVGAATGAVAIAMAHAAWRAGSAPSHRCVVALHGEDGERSAIALETGSVEKH